jgi:hypothetical protein
VPRDTGLSSADAENDFQRARRAQVLARIGAWLRREPDDVTMVLAFEEVLADLGGRVAEQRLGLRTVPLDAIVGTVDRPRDFDRRFRPRSNRGRERWQQVDLAVRRGAAMPPVELYKLGEWYFVRDGHHRVSVARAMRGDSIDAYVTEVRTLVPPDAADRGPALLFRDFERVFHHRVPLPAEAAGTIHVRDPWSYAELAENVEAWGFRVLQREGRWMDRSDVARRWFHDEYLPVVAMLREADLIGEGTDAEAYLRLAAERYRLVLAHEWSEDIIERLRGRGGRGG